jgi:hypothetical protein
MATVKKKRKPRLTKKANKFTVEIFDPFGPGFRVLHKRGAAVTHVGGAAEAPNGGANEQKLTLEVFDPFGPGFRVLKKPG